MSTVPLSEPTGAPRARRPYLWPTVALLSVAMTCADGFWLTSLQGAIGSVARARGPFESWLRVSALMLPVFAVAVHKALTRARRRYGPRLNTARSVAATALLVAAAGSVVGIGALAANSAYEYNLQVSELQLTRTSHTDPASPDHAHASCSATCEAARATLAVHVRGVTYAGGAVVLTNLLLVGGVVALRGAHWMPSGRVRRPAPTRA